MLKSEATAIRSALSLAQVVIQEDEEWIRDTPKLQSEHNDHIRLCHPRNGLVVVWLDGEALLYRHDKRMIADEECVYLDKFHTSESYNGDLPLNEYCKHQLRDHAICLMPPTWDHFIHMGDVPSDEERETVPKNANIQIAGDQTLPAHASLELTR